MKGNVLIREQKDTNCGQTQFNPVNSMMSLLKKGTETRGFTTFDTRKNKRYNPHFVDGLEGIICLIYVFIINLSHIKTTVTSFVKSPVRSCLFVFINMLYILFMKNRSQK